MKPITVKNQVKLGPARCFRLAITSMSYRLTRSSITVSILALAVAFLAYMLYYGLISHDTKFGAFTELKKSRLLAEWISRISTPDQEAFIHTSVLTKKASRLQEYQKWAALTDEEMSTLATTAAKMKEFDSYFEKIPKAVRAILIADRPSRDVAGQIGDPAYYEIFSSAIKTQKAKVPFGSFDALNAFAQQQVPAYFALIKKIQAGHQTAIDTLIARNASQRPIVLFMNMSPAFTDALAAAGFDVPLSDRTVLSSQARIENDVRIIDECIALSDVRTAVTRQLSLGSLSEVTVLKLINWIDGKSRAEWFVAQVNGRVDITAQRVVEAASFMKRNADLQKTIGYEEVLPRTSIWSLDSATLWLILVSFLVCFFGIANTMLMSVTDRYTEIATMKCIGALEGYIMLLFAFEALFQGIIGSCIGIILGLVLALSRGLSSYGLLIFDSMPWLDLLALAGISFVTGIAIAAIAATLPSWSAARLAPMEAMRVD